MPVIDANLLRYLEMVGQPVFAQIAPHFKTTILIV
jgi:hypothetical protein